MQLEDGVTRQDFFLFFDEKQEENVKEKLAAKHKEKALIEWIKANKIKILNSGIKIA